jgi:hypothetical protein
LKYRVKQQSDEDHQPRSTKEHDSRRAPKGAHNEKEYSREKHYSKYDDERKYYKHDYARHPQNYHSQQKMLDYSDREMEAQQAYEQYYLNRYERMSRYGPYDEDAQYPDDYYVRSHKNSNYYYNNHYSKSHDKGLYSRVQEYRNEHHYYDERPIYYDEDRNRSDYYEGPRYQRDSNSRRYLIFDGKKVKVNDKRVPRPQQPQNRVWSTNREEAPRYARSSSNNLSDQESSRNDDKHKKKSSKAVVPAAVPYKNSKDLRPAVFIKDLKKRSLALEEEKAQHKENQQRKKVFKEIS